MYLIIFIIFIAITIFYLKKIWNPYIPSYLKQKKMLFFGHRGAPDIAYENTINSFLEAVKSNVDGIELDVQLSADKKLIVFHDLSFYNSDGKEQKINKLNYSEIKKHQLKNGEKIPLLSEVLVILPKKCTKIIEIKCKEFISLGVENKILDELIKYNAIETSIISSFNPLVLRRIKKMNSQIQTALLWTTEEPLFFINTPLIVWFCMPDGLHIDINDINKNFTKWIRKKNMSILAFTITNIEELKKASKLNLDGVIIDDLNLIQHL